LNAAEIAEAVSIPKNYLSKILHDLRRAGILTSVRGKHGGFTLGIAPDQLQLLEIVSRFDSVGTGRRCLMGRPECSDVSPCPVHGRWKAVAEQIAKFFQETTVADVLD
jgi:Rrf2 family protein